MLKSRIFKKGSSGGLSLTEIGFGTAPLGNLYKPISENEANSAPVSYTHLTLPTKA